MVTRARADYSVREVYRITRLAVRTGPTVRGTSCDRQHAQRRPCACCAPPG